MSFTVKEILGIAQNQMSKAGIEDSRVDAELIMCFMMHYDRHQLFLNWGNPVDEKVTDTFFDLIALRNGGKPLQYITGKQDFMDVSIRVDSRVLIPRQDTEVLVREVIDYLNGGKRRIRVLDLCTGSGAIAISLAKSNPNCKITASDISEDALTVARNNASQTKTDARISFVKSDMFEKLKRKKYDVIVSNPPYIPSRELPALAREIFEHEPLMALDGGDDGLHFYRTIADEGLGHLRKGGAIFLEVGYNQGADVIELFTERGISEDKIDTVQDVAGNDRVIIVKPWAEMTG